MVMQQIEFQSSAWNSKDAPARFYVNINIGFADIPTKDGTSGFAGSGRLTGLVAEAPPHYDLTPENYDEVLAELLTHLPVALAEIPKHYADVRERAEKGLCTPIPLPETWR